MCDYHKPSCKLDQSYSAELKHKQKTFLNQPKMDSKSSSLVSLVRHVWTTVKWFNQQITLGWFKIFI